MHQSAYKYLSSYVAPLVVWFSLSASGLWTYFALVFVFGLIPALEFFFTGSEKNMTEVEESLALQNRLYDYIIWSLVPIQILLLFYFLERISDPSVWLSEKVGMVTAFGISCGVLGINAAHELGHRVTKHEQWMSKILLSTTLYMHFFIEHNFGHHKNVSTDDDPASSKYGENIYAFFIRTIRDSWLSAWQIEAKRLAQAQQGFWSWHNEMLVYQVIQASIVAAIGWFYGLQVLIFFLMSATMGFLLLETVNYIEHYGLRRQKISEKHYEPVQPNHSWNSNHALGRLLLLELTRHSDHHYKATRKYQILRHFDESPQMPAGYPAMMLLALVPPLWFRVMHKQIAQLHQIETQH
ncbi:MAG: alkane 1-monooxygenase [Saprospiraceae bacterium]|nr:alkane 1-monooxygenase [Saprospiraceae bacterium]